MDTNFKWEPPAPRPQYPVQHRPKKRSLLAVFVMGFFTLWFYPIIWYSLVMRETSENSETNYIRTGWVLTGILVGFFGGYIVDSLRDSRQSPGLEMWIGLFTVAWYVAMLWMALNVTSQTSHSLGFEPTLRPLYHVLLTLLFGFFWLPFLMLIVQRDLNQRIAERSTQSAAEWKVTSEQTP